MSEPPRVVVTLYTKPDCHLCEPVAETIGAASKLRRFDFVRRNILQDPSDFDRYKHAIPVVTVNGREIARHRLALNDLLAALDSATAGPGGQS
jgi:alkyl hydroperoxide reductase subunit AhpF